MLHDPSHRTPPPANEPIDLRPGEKNTLRRLIAELAEVASLPVHNEIAEGWRRLNDLEPSRPMVWINEIPWHEMDVDGELALHCEHPWARDLETTLRRTLYQWHHLPGDMIVGGTLDCPLAIHSTDFGILEDVDIERTDAASDIVSRHFRIQIRDWPDLEKIRMPGVTHHGEITARWEAAMTELASGLMPVRRLGQTHIWFTPWDWLIRWWGIEEAMIDMIERPDLVHAAVERMVDAWMTELDQFADMNLLALDCDNTRIGSGGYGYTHALPGEPFDPARVRPHNMWGCSNAQIFSEVSPEMHWEFAVKHDLRWLERWGLTYYGCCEPLHHKMEVLRRIPNLRKVSINFHCKLDAVARNVGADYVWSYKPNPAVLAEDGWRPEAARAELHRVADAARGVGANVEFIMKDISTVRYQPCRLWEWSRIAMEEADRGAG